MSHSPLNIWPTVRSPYSDLGLLLQPLVHSGTTEPLFTLPRGIHLLDDYLLLRRATLKLRLSQLLFHSQYGDLRELGPASP